MRPTGRSTPDIIDQIYLRGAGGLVQLANVVTVTESVAPKELNHFNRVRSASITANLAPGVDTVMSVGDLSPATVCEPAGCWNDDRAALTFESEIVFKAVEDGRAMITVDNRGSAFGTDATYDLSVAEILNKVRSPFNTTSLGQIAGLAQAQQDFRGIHDPVADVCICECNEITTKDRPK